MKSVTTTVAALWLFVCLWCPLTHDKSHQAQPDRAATHLTLGAGDSCALCSLQAAPTTLVGSSLTLPAATLVLKTSRLALLLPTTALVSPRHTTRGPPTPLS
ncbi:hypothetical protein [Armatimonas sp.]|uniref:hypothetical protein n=1 Tax=Armatimonas sp. TaxID=1872638 RepID=UPI00286C7590|nr:hypothetical protein [Armatimonas sp.]